ncbi:hypothetical protein DW083_20285 [Parabacteroides sp. AF48-14]|uniref:hypothetical protein n=1 Tax=Parabacteroides sp. AF48-14 TaxID=2292052 RepID=UPI000EFF3695|nr:hypothetical protein [Parabacteroides sp. AF48-14]RHO65713.1 hypothetical protein DW083_20285 [Parabacteroides sp. AF48-14]
MALPKKERPTGLKKALFGDVPEAGGMPEELVQLGRTYKGSASFTTEADTVQDIYCEEEPAVPMESISSDPGIKQVKLNLAEFDNEALIAVFGGTEGEAEDVTVDGKKYSVKRYKAPSDMVQIEKSVRIITRNDNVIDIPRALVTARFQWNLTSNDIAQIEITAKILAPIGASDAPYSIYKLGEPKVGA